VRQVIPNVSASARKTITGTVRINVRVDVDPSGKVIRVKLVSPERSKYFSNLALKAAEQWAFSPPTVGGQPAASTWTLHFGFSRTSAKAAAERAVR
jgi:TonB family protein